MTNTANDRRDPNSISEYLRVEWEDVIAEPEGVRSLPCVWKNSRVIFRGTKSCCYKALTIFCGFPLAIIVGISFACLTFQHIWCVGPALGHCRAVCHVIKQYFRAILDACVAPCCADVGLMCSRIRIRFNDSDTSADYVSGTGSLAIKPATAIERMKLAARDHHPATVEEVI